MKICFGIVEKIVFFTIVSFILWMPHGAHNVFALLIIFVGNDWKLKKITIGLFKSLNTTWQALVRNLAKLLDQYGLRKQIIVYVKDENPNLNGMTNALKFVVL